MLSYAYFVLKKHISDYQTDNDINTNNTGQKYLIHTDFHRIIKIKYEVSYYRIKFFNKLSTAVKMLHIKQFKSVIKKC